jgi:hypothetical protein
MNYIIIICSSIVLLHFVLYYLNIDPFELSKPKISDKCISTKDNVCEKEIEESINELKKLNEYIDNESRHITNC